MQIQKINNCKNINMKSHNDDSSWLTRLEKYVFEKVPKKTFSEQRDKVFFREKCTRLLSNPAIHRFVVGATGCVLQPIIDYYNHKVDKDTREISRNRTIVKIIVGTSVGMFVRGSCFSLIKKLINININKKFNFKIVSDNIIDECKKDEKYLENFQISLSNILAVIVSAFTNFLIDAPLTTFFTDKLNERVCQKQIRRKEVQKC